MTNKKEIHKIIIKGDNTMMLNIIRQLDATGKLDYVNEEVINTFCTQFTTVEDQEDFKIELANYLNRKQLWLDYQQEQELQTIYVSETKQSEGN